MRLLQSIAVFAGLAYSKLIELLVGTSSFNSNPGLNTIQFAANYDLNNIADAAAWRKYLKKGRALNCLLDMTDEQAGKNWPDPLGRVPPSASKALSAWYWHEGSYDQDRECDFANDGNGYYRIGVALAALGLDARCEINGGKNKGYQIEHLDPEEEYETGEKVPADDQTYNVGRDAYKATGGHYRFVMNAEQGALFVQSLDAPRYAATTEWQRTPQSDELPKLQFASDIISGYWLRAPSPKNLKYYFANNVVNKETLPLINKILVNGQYTEIPEWPGVRVWGDSEEGAALVGSPIGSTLAFLLLQHKDELGNKRISDITIFRNYKEDPMFQADIQLVFRIEDVADSDLLPEDYEMVDADDDMDIGLGIGRGGRVKRRDSVVGDGVDLGRNMRRLHRVNVNRRGETVVVSHGFERV